MIARQAAHHCAPLQLATAAAVVVLRSFVSKVAVRSSRSFALEAAVARGFSNRRECRSRGLGLLLSL